MSNLKNEVGVILTNEEYLRIKKYGAPATICTLILSSLVRILPEAGTSLRERLSWTNEQCIAIANNLGEDPFPLVGSSLDDVASEEQIESLDQAPIFEQIALEFHCLRMRKGIIKPPKATKKNGKSLTVRLGRDEINWWQKQFTTAQSGLSHIIGAVTDWIVLTQQEETIAQLEKHADILHKALNNLTIPPGDIAELKSIVRSKLLVFAQGDIKKEAPEDFIALLNEEIPEFVYLCLILKYGYGFEAKKPISPRLTNNATEFMMKMFGNKNTGVSYAGEMFPQLFHATVHEEILPIFSIEDIEKLRLAAIKHKIAPQMGQHPGLAIDRLAKKLTEVSYRDRIKQLSLAGKICLEVAVIARNFQKDGPLVSYRTKEKRE